ncbi:MAG: hypothetical protein HZA46_00410 [Planctomycetales bacterium]|nr:hypothetical protein [Planctomycetales bacterium]
MTDSTEHPKERIVRAPPPVPFKYSGQWIAWNKDKTAILAHALDVTEVHRAAQATGELMPLMQKIPHLDRIFIGSTCRKESGVIGGDPVVAPTGTDSIAQGAALGIDSMFDLKPQRGVITRTTCGNFAPLGLALRLAPQTQGCALGYRMTPPSGLTSGMPVTLN